MRLLILYGRTALLAAAFVAVFAGMSAAQVKPKLKHVAVVNTEIDESAAKAVKKAEARQITAMLRREATKILLKKDGYNVMTEETVQAQGSDFATECNEENCVITYGAKTGADYVVRGIISTLDKDLTLTVEIYETEDGFLIATSENLISSGNIKGLLEKATDACSQMYKIFADIVKDSQHPPRSKPEPVAQTPAVETTPVAQTPKAESATVAQTPKSEPEVVTQKSVPETAAHEPEPEAKIQSRARKIYTVDIVATPNNGGRVSRGLISSLEGSSETVTATPNKGYRFAGWVGVAGIVDTTNSLKITMDGNKQLRAIFLKNNKYPLKDTAIFIANQTEGGRVSCSPDCSRDTAKYKSGTIITVTAIPDSGYIFTGWLFTEAGRWRTDTLKMESIYILKMGASDSVKITTNPITIIMPRRSVTLTANFKGYFIDSRDNKTYTTAKIGNQTWMAENLNHQTSSGSWCYRNDTSNSAKYGRLYDWNTAKTACPTGWHLPSSQEWNVLVTTADGPSAGKNLKSTASWPWGGRGADSYDFSALPGGVRYTRGGFGEAGVSGYWWTSTESGNGTAYRRRIDYDNDRVGELAVYPESKEDFGKRFGFSVRCLKDD